MESHDKTAPDVRDGNHPAPVKKDEKVTVEATQAPDGDTKTMERAESGKKKVKKEQLNKRHSKTKHKKAKKHSPPEDESSDSSSDDDSETSSSSDSDDSDSESELETRRRRGNKKRHDSHRSKKKAKSRKQKRISPPISESDSESIVSQDELDISGAEDIHIQQDLNKQLQLLQLQQLQQGGNMFQYNNGGGLGGGMPPIYDHHNLRHGLPPPRNARRARSRGRNIIDTSLILDGKSLRKEKKRPKASKLDYKRVDQVWDNTIHNYKLQDTAEGIVDSQYDEFLFHVRRTFDWEGKYKATVVDIRSKLLRECLQAVMGNIKGVSLVEETPKLDPNLLFL